jgi:hypothetical protein
MRSNYVLNHVHTLELTVSLEAALADVHRWLAAAAAGGKAGVGAATPAAIAAVLGGAPDLGIHQPNGDGASGIVFADAAGISPENESEPESSGLAPVDKDGLDFLAVGFTICKMCFNAGQLALLPPLVRLLQSEHKLRDLHKTTVKNEAAYFGCIKQLTALFPYPPPPYDADAPPIYVVGDSHCLAAGWRVLTVAGAQRSPPPRHRRAPRCVSVVPV